MGQIHNEDKQCNSFKVSLRKVGQKSYLTKSKNQVHIGSYKKGKSGVESFQRWV